MAGEIIPAEVHPKGWGREVWVVNNSKYCGKIMHLNAGKQCSIHYHKVKDETFHVLSGMLELHLFKGGYPEEQSVVVMKQGDTVHIPTGLVHRFRGIEDSMILEISTQHFEEDSYRHLKGD